jgi:hypothetical protein
VALKLPSVVEDADDFDRAVRRHSIHQDVASATAVPCNMERAKARQDLISSLGTGNIGTIGKLANRLNQRGP